MGAASGLVLAVLAVVDECAAATASSSASGQYWTGIAGGAHYAVSLSPWNDSNPPYALTDGVLSLALHLAAVSVRATGWSRYTISFDAEGGDVWLAGQAPTVHCYDRWHQVGDRSLEWAGLAITNGMNDDWGPYRAANASWVMRPSGVAFHTSIVHYTARDVLSFEQMYGGHCPDANFTELPSNRSTTLDETAHAALNPSSEFPAFGAPEDGTSRLTSSRMGFFTTGGVMNYKAMSRGTGLQCSKVRKPNGEGERCTGFSGGARGGPLVIFDVNVTRGNAMVLSTGNHFTSSVLGLRRSCSHANWRRHPSPTLTKAPGTDYSDNDLGGLYNLTESECATACLTSPMCNAYTYGQGQIPGWKRCYLKSSTGFSPRSNTPQASGYFCKDDPQDSSLVAGLMGYVRTVPPGTMLRFVLSPSGGGITEAVHKWGQVMRDVFHLQRSPSVHGGATADPVGRSLGYWTDVSCVIST